MLGKMLKKGIIQNQKFANDVHIDGKFNKITASKFDPIGGNNEDIWLKVDIIGETGPAGGIIFYDKGFKSDGWQFLECWTEDAPTTLQWKTSNSWTSPNNEWPAAIGSGYENCYNNSGNNSSHPAIWHCTQATHGGYNDWFLPSKDELNEMYVNLRLKGLGHFQNEWYWSSTQFSEFNAWIQYFSTGLQNLTSKFNFFRVRAVRRF